MTCARGSTPVGPIGDNGAMDAAILVVPANEASWDDLRTVFGTRGDAARWQCQWFKTAPAQWRAIRGSR